MRSDRLRKCAAGGPPIGGWPRSARVVARGLSGVAYRLLRASRLRGAWRGSVGSNSDTWRRTRAGIRVHSRRGGCARTRGRARRRRGTCQRPGRRRAATGHSRALSARRRPSAGDAGGPTPTRRAAMPAGAGACRRHAPPMPHRACARRDWGAPSIRSTWARPVTVPLHTRPFRRNIRVALA